MEASEATYPVLVKPGFIQKFGHVAPVTALAEIVWNSLDADATTVDVVLDESDFGSERLIIRDNGTGFPHGDAPDLFQNLGESWKKGRHLTARDRRYLHGQEGEGRFRAFALGRDITWHVVIPNANGFEEFSVRITADRPSSVSVTQPKLVGSAKPGVTVVISELEKNSFYLKSEGAAQSLCEIFSSYLRSYPQIRLSVPAGIVDPATAILSLKQISLPLVRYEETSYPVNLEIVRWNVTTERILHFCDERGVSIGRSHLRLQAPGFNVSAHLQSTLVPRLAQDGVLGSEEMHPALVETLDQVYEEVKTFHRECLAEEAKAIVDEWRSNDIYPYAGAPANQVERIERQVFDIVASRVNEHLPGFTDAKKESKQFQLRLLRQAVEKSPEDLRRILSQVLDLPPAQRRELADLLEYVSLSGIISAAKLVADRLLFLAGLEKLLFTPHEKNSLKERKQLHRLIASQTWIFGEKFSLSVDDQSLNEVLRNHLEGKNINSIDLAGPVLTASGRRGIIDLMFSRRVPENENRRLHLVVELKRPNLKVGQKELSQIKDYASAISNDERFRDVDASWEFWLITNDYDGTVKNEAHQSGRAPGLVLQTDGPAKMRIWVKTWAQILEDNRARLQFIQDSLDYQPDYEDALQQIKARYSKLFLGHEETHGTQQQP